MHIGHGPSKFVFEALVAEASFTVDALKVEFAEIIKATSTITLTIAFFMIFFSSGDLSPATRVLQTSMYL
jgi:hypothetical protein